jgi:methyltransferase-like protein
VQIEWSQKLKLANEKSFQEFVQKMANRILQGYCRYGNPKVENKHLTRMKLELKEYVKTGNAEHLFNIANYAHLEFFMPEHKRFHYDPYAKSATRERVL